MNRKIFKTTILATLLSASLALPAQAQSDAGYGSEFDRLGMNAGVKLTVPFGAQSKAKKDKARLGLTLSLDHQSQNRWSGLTNSKSADMLELGFYENGTPNLSFLGEDLYAPLFDPNYQQDEQANMSNTTIYILVGAAVVASAALLVVATNEYVDDYNDCLERNGGNTGRC